MINWAKILEALAPLLQTESIALFIAMIYAVIGKWANKGEDFEFRKFAYTLFIASIAGLIVGLTGWSFSDAMTWLGNIGLIYVIGKLFKIAYTIVEPILPKE